MVMKNNYLAYSLITILAIHFGNARADFWKVFGDSVEMNATVGLANGFLQGVSRNLLCPNLSARQLYPLLYCIDQWQRRVMPALCMEVPWWIAPLQQGSLSSLNMIFLGMPFAVCKARVSYWIAKRINNEKKMEIFANDCDSYAYPAKNNDSRKTANLCEFKKILSTYNALIDVAQVATLCGSMSIAGSPVLVCALHAVIPLSVACYNYFSDRSAQPALGVVKDGGPISLFKQHFGN
jgi:hypothetical protein